MKNESGRKERISLRGTATKAYGTVGPVGRLVQPQYKAGVRWALYIKPKFWNLNEGNKNIQIF